MRTQWDGLVFCVQDDEYINLPGTYNIYDVKKVTAGAVSPGYYLTGYAAWVYTKFVTLFGGDNDNTFPNAQSPPTGNWKTTFDAYQRAIWAGMIQTNDFTSLTTNNIGVLGSMRTNALTDTIFVQCGITISDFASANNITIGNLASEKIGMQNTGDIYVLQLGPTNPNNQDQLFIFSAEEAGVPEPTTLLIWSVLGGAGASVVAARRRKGWSAEKRQAIRNVVSGHKA